MIKINIINGTDIIVQGSVIRIHETSMDNQYFLLARLLADTYTLIGLDAGERWTNTPLVCNPDKLTFEAIEKYVEKRISLVKEITVNILN